MQCRKKSMLFNISWEGEVSGSLYSRGVLGGEIRIVKQRQKGIWDRNDQALNKQSMRISQLVYISKTVARDNDDEFRHHEGRGKTRSTDQEGRRDSPNHHKTQTYLQYPEKVKIKTRKRRRCPQNFPVLFKVGREAKRRERKKTEGEERRGGGREWAGRD